MSKGEDRAYRKCVEVCCLGGKTARDMHGPESKSELRPGFHGDVNPISRAPLLFLYEFCVLGSFPSLSCSQQVLFIRCRPSWFNKHGYAKVLWESVIEYPSSQ